MVGHERSNKKSWIFAYNLCHKKNSYCEITFIRGLPICVVFVGWLNLEIKNPTNNETWEAV